MPSKDPLGAYVSVDVETAGPCPSRYSLLSIGACLACDPERTFYVELQPIHANYREEALAVSGLSLEELAEKGLPPAEAMARFETWVKANVPPDRQPVFVAFNAPFDWMFVCDYFHRFLGHNPFGYLALDLKALYMGIEGVEWDETSLRQVAARYMGDRQLTHHALRDAQDQAEILRAMVPRCPGLSNAR